MMKLIEPAIEYDKQIRAYRKEFLDCGDSVDGTAHLIRFENPQDWIDIRHLSNDFLKQYGGHVGYSAAPSDKFKLIMEKIR